jgi:ABC-type transporter Mla MlaB component
MLRISAHDDGESTNFTIEGKLTADTASELEGVWKAALEQKHSRPIVVKLAAVSFIDSESRELLTRMHRQGVRLIPTGCLMKAIVEQIETASPVNVGSHSHRDRQSGPAARRRRMLGAAEQLIMANDLL